jgi:hypothetical protein
MPAWICNTCGLELSTKHRLQCHLDRKFKCVPPGQHQHECKTCHKHFDGKGLLDQHLRTQRHERAAAAVAAGACSAGSQATPECTADTRDAGADDVIVDVEAAVTETVSDTDAAVCESSVSAGEALGAESKPAARSLNLTPALYATEGRIVNSYNVTNTTNNYNCCARCPGHCRVSPSHSRA